MGMCDCEHGSHNHAHDQEHSHGDVHNHAHDCADAHGHTHDHNDAHKHVLIDADGIYLALFEHEDSLVASYRFALDAPLGQAREQMEAFTRAIAEQVDNQGGLVGHIKATAIQQGEGFRISVTLAEPDVALLPTGNVHVEGVAIVVGVAQDWFAECMEHEVRAIAQ